MQLEHSDIQNDQRSDCVHIVCDGLTTPENVGMVFRLADAFGVEEVHFLGTDLDKKNRKIRRTARGTDAFVPFRNHDSDDWIAALKAKGFTLIAIEITSESRSIKAFDFSAFPKKVLVVGSEKHGVRPAVLSACQHHVHIPMYGKNTSMNVVHALGIALYASAP